MGIEAEAVARVNSSMALASSILAGNIAWFVSKKKLARHISDVAHEFYLAKKQVDGHPDRTASLIKIRDTIVESILATTPDMQKEAFVATMSAMETEKLAEFLGEKFVEIHRFGMVLKRKADELREEFESRRASLADELRRADELNAKLDADIEHMKGRVKDESSRCDLAEKQNVDLRDRLEKAEALLKFKDDALLAAAGRIEAQSRALGSVAERAAESCRVAASQTTSAFNEPQDRSKEIVGDPGDDL